MDDVETAPVDTGGAEPVSPPEIDSDAGLYAVYDKMMGEAEKPAPAAPETAAADTSSADQPPKEGSAPAITPASAAPNSWSAEMKEKWGSLPPEAQGYIAQREKEAHDQISRMGQDVARLKPVGELISTRQEVFDRHGIAPHEGISLMLDMQDLLDKDPRAGLSAIAQTYGIDLATEFGSQQPGQQTQGRSPEVAQLQQTVRQLQQQLAQRDNVTKVREQREAAARRTEAKSAVDKWGEGKEHFASPDVKKLMGTLLGNGTATDLDDAYDKACHAIPEIRQKLNEAAQKAAEEQRKTAEKQRLADEAKAAADARKNRGINGGGKAGHKASGGRWDDDEALSATFDRVAG